MGYHSLSSRDLNAVQEVGGLLTGKHNKQDL